MEKPKISVYGAPWCPDYKRSKQFLSEHHVEYDWIDVDLDPSGLQYVQEVNDGKQIIPTIVFEDGSILVEPSNAELAAKLGISPRASRHSYDLVVVGSGPTGLTAALYAAREGIETLVIERSDVGGQAGLTEKIENYPGFPGGVGGNELTGRMREQAEGFGVEILPAQEVTKIGASMGHNTVETETGDHYCASAVLVATGTHYRRLGVPGEEDFIGAGIHFCATCDGPFYKGEEMLVVGGGNSGVEEGLFLTKFASKVTILERADRLGASQILQQKAADNENVEVRLQTVVEEFRGNGRLGSVVLKDLRTDSSEEMSPGAVFVFIGLQPNTDFLKETVDLDGLGFVQTGATLETSKAGVFAAGDVRLGSTKQVASAVGEGATAALMVRHYLEKNQGSRSYNGAT